MEKLNTIQKRENLNTVFVLNEKGNGGAFHDYVIEGGDKYNQGEVDPKLKEPEFCLRIEFQDGPRKLDDSRHGVLDTDLLEIVRHRVLCFQKGDFATRENAIALTHIEEALLWMNKRVEDRIERNVLGTNNK